MTRATSLEDGAAHRAGSYFLFSRLLHEPPSAASLRVLADTLASIRSEGVLEGDLAELHRVADASAGNERHVTDLAVEFTRILGGLSERNGAPPIESVAREGKLLGETTAAVSIAYAEAGFPEPLPEAGPPDHLATELRFLALCCHEEAQAWKRADGAAALAWLERERTFLDEHLLAWAPAYCVSLAARSTASYYTVLARLIAEGCSVDREDLTAVLDDARSMPRRRRAR